MVPSAPRVVAADLEANYSSGPSTRKVSRQNSFCCYLGALFAGAISVINAGSTAQLGKILGDKFWAGFVSNLVATAFVGLFVTLGPPLSKSVADAWSACKKNGIEAVSFSGGVFGAIFVILYTVTPPVCGFGVFFTWVVVGQVTAALLFDGCGWLWRPRIDMSLKGYGGALLVMLGTLIFQDFWQVSKLTDIAETGAGHSTMTTLGCIVAAYLAGVVFVVQTSLNVKSGDLLGTPIRGAFVTFLVGALVSVLPAVVATSLRTPREAVTWSNVWTFFSGLFSCLSVTGAIFFPKYIGFTQTFCWTIAGQLICSALFDARGWFTDHVETFGWMRVLGSVLVLSGVVILQSYRGTSRCAIEKREEHCCEGSVMEKAADGENNSQDDGKGDDGESGESDGRCKAETVITSIPSTEQGSLASDSDSWHHQTAP